VECRNNYWHAKVADKVDEEKRFQIAEDYISALEQENHLLECRLAEHQITHWPRIRELPKDEQKPFRQWLSGQTCPLMSGVPHEEQDAFYPWDYDRWRRHLNGERILWD
jgi:hypothetical protein